jgi:hypothetical protein
MATARNGARTRAAKRIALHDKRAEKEATESIRSAYGKLHKRPERQRSFRYHHYA